MVPLEDFHKALDLHLYLALQHLHNIHNKYQTKP